MILRFEDSLGEAFFPELHEKEREAIIRKMTEAVIFADLLTICSYLNSGLEYRHPLFSC